MSDFLELVHDPKCKPRFEALLRLAAGRGDVDLVAERISWGIDPNCQSKAGRTPLICNVTSSVPSSGVVRALLKAGADPHHMDHKGLTALDYANRKLARLNLRPRKPPAKAPRSTRTANSSSLRSSSRCSPASVATTPNMPRNSSRAT